jgi:hypothetical protein
LPSTVKFFPSDRTQVFCDAENLQGERPPGLLQGLDETILRECCEEQAAYSAREYPDRQPFAGPVHWAAFIATGLAFPLASPD